MVLSSGSGTRRAPKAAARGQALPARPAGFREVSLSAESVCSRLYLTDQALIRRGCACCEKKKTRQRYVQVHAAMRGDANVGARRTLVRLRGRRCIAGLPPFVVPSVPSTKGRLAS